MSIEQGGDAFRFPSRRSIDKNLDIREEMTPEALAVYDIRIAIGIAEQAINEGNLTSTESAQEVEEMVRGARNKGFNLSGIPNLDERVSKVRREAPFVEVEYCVKSAESASDVGEEAIFLTAVWYWEARARLLKSESAIDPRAREALRRRLSSVARAAGIDENLPLEEHIFSEKHDYPEPASFIWKSWDPPASEEYGEKREKIEEINSRIEEGLQNALQWLDVFEMRYNSMNASARTNSMLLPKDSKRVQEVITRLDLEDKEIFPAIEKLRSTIRVAKSELLGALESLAPEHVGVEDIRGVYERVGALFGSIEKRKKYLQSSLVRRTEHLSEFIPLLKP